jgi:type I restriction enzyme S subunit
MKATWEMKKLGEICEERKEKNIKSLDLPVYAVSNIWGFVLSEEYFNKRVYSESLRNYKLVYKNDFAYNPARVNVGSIGLYKNNEPGLVSPMYIVFTIKEREALEPDFLYYLFKTDFYKNKIKDLASSHGSIRQVLKLDDLFDLEVPTPPLPIQQKIVKILDTIQEAIDIQEKIIEKVKELKKSLMAELFKYGGPSFRKGRKLKKTEIGEIPEDWEVVKLGEVCEIVYGVQASVSELKEETGRIPILTNKNITDEGTIDLTNLNFYPENLIDSKKHLLKKGDIIFNWRSGSVEHVGKSALFNLEGKFTFASFLLRFRPKPNVTNSYFLNSYLNKIRKEGFLKFFAHQASINQSLNASISSNIPISLPSLPEQREIAEILQTIDQKIEIEKRKKELYEELFKTMLNKIMSQEIDVEKIEV